MTATLRSVNVDPLDSRKGRMQVRGRARRAAVLDAIRNEPGLTLAGVAGRVDADPTTVRYHLRLLERRGLVVTERHGSELRVRLSEVSGGNPAPTPQPT